MSGRGRYRGNRGRQSHTLSSVARETATTLAPDSPVLAMFKEASIKLNERQDRHERLVKLSRDITIESKRIIFLLHSIILKDSSAKQMLEAKDRIQKLINGPIQIIAMELENSPAHLHSRAVTAGFQEFIEARTFCSLMDTKEITPYQDIQKEFTYTIMSENNDERTVVTLLPHTDYMLGLADLSGELMRKSINSISSGDSEDCFFSCRVVRELFAGYLGLFGMNKELARKLSTTRANVSKVEYAVYALRVRGGEAPPPLLLSTHPEWDRNDHSDDEGYF